MKQGTPLLLVLFWLSLFASPSLSTYITIPEHPTGNCGSWNETYYFWDTDNGSSSSNSFNGTVPKGVYNKSDLKQFFCSIDIPALPLGSFCFYLNTRYSSCPFGFTAGTHTQDEEDTNNQSGGGGNPDDRPKLTGYSGSPVWNFCCGSGSPSTIISFDAIRDSLPANFTLLRRGGSCQMVHGRRNATVGMVFWDDENSINFNDAAGAVPDVITDADVNTRIYYCSYGPSFLPRPTTAITLAAKSDASAQISWPAPAGASKYRVQLFDGSTSLLNATVSTTSYSFPSLRQNKLYTVYVYSGLFDSVTGSDIFETAGVNLQFTTCPFGYTGLSCIPYCTNGCVHGDCTAPNFCTCSDGWSGATCNFCGAGFYPSGGNCEPCPSCVAGRGSCFDGPVGSGLCICKPGYTGPLCENCAPGYFAEGGDCLPCSSTCYNCTAASTCNFCAAGLALQTDQTCKSGCSESFTYLDASTGSCQLCDSNCLTCNGGGSNQCLSCNETRFLHGTTCVDSCPTGTFSDGSGVCRACSFPCTSCEGASGSQCLACASPYLLRGTQCITPLDCTNLGGFETSGSCQSCDPSCKTCSSPGSSCVSCHTGSYLLNGQCLLECPNTYYANDDLLMCKPCLSPCLTCSSGSSNDCTSCSFPKKLADTHCVDECPVGLYLNLNNNTCTPCSSQCLTCTGPGDSCLVCRNEDYSVLNGTCVERCPDKMFSSNRRCQDCFSSCATCSSSSPTGCLTCPSDLLFQQGQCLLNCTSKFYLDADSRTCLPCQSSCETCSADGCLTCPPERVFEEGQCLFNCTSQFYLDHQTCFPCHSSCETCSTSGPGNCLTCPSDRVWNNGNCISPEACVNLGRFNNSGICTACHESCKTCSGASAEECLSCYSSSFLLNSTCLSQCPEGFYGNLAVSQCSHCNSVCKTCTSGSNNDCTSCREPLKLSGTTCTSSDCAIGTYYNESTNGCSSCASYCLTCTGPGDSCLLCKDSALNILDGACVADCPIGKFSLNKRCEDCHLSCKTCSNAASTGCLTCQTDLFFQAGSCLSECSSNYYLGDDNSTCHACHSSCETCSSSGALSCLTCPANKVFRDGTCLSLSECTALGGYNNSGICADCADSCLTCFGGDVDQCLSCSAPNFLLDSLCLPQCPIGFYGAQEMNQCRACHSSCQSCSSSSANDCLSCKAPLILAGSSCESSCPIATFFNETTNACNECSSNCLTCNNTATYCLTCPKKTVLYLATCVSKCPEGYAASQGECSIEAFKTQRDRTLGGAIGGSIAALFLIVTLAFIFVSYKRRRDKDVIAVISNISMAQLNPKTSLEATQADGNFVARPVSTSRSFVSATDQVTLLNSIIDIALPAFLHLNMTTQVREESPLGSGGASTLFRGRLIDPALIEKHKFENVIVKHIRPIPNAPDEKNAAFFHKEVSINWALNKSSHIVKIVGYSEEPRCIVFKMYEMDMFAMINDPKEKLSPLRAFVLAFQVAKGIQSIHRMNAAHRDLKTKNILIERGMTDDDRDIRAVICDFGLAVYDAETAIYDPSIEGNEVLKGFSPKYAAPEVFSSPENPDGMTAGYQKVDMYAFAVIIWELISRRIPWDGYSVDQIKSAVLAGQRPIFPNPEKDTYLNALIPIAEACWSDDPFRRPAIYEIVGKMEAFLE